MPKMNDDVYIRALIVYASGHFEIEEVRDLDVILKSKSVVGTTVKTAQFVRSNIGIGGRKTIIPVYVEK